MRLKTGLRNAIGLTGILAFVFTTAAPSGFAYSSKEAKEKVEAAEKALQNAQRADDRTHKAADDWTEKATRDIQDSQNAQKKREEANAAREKANQTGKQEDIKAAEKAENIAKGAEKKAEESKKAFEAALQTYEKAKQDEEAAKAKVPPLIEPAEKAVDELPQSSVKDKLKERIKKLKEELQQLAFAFPTQLDLEKVSLSIVGTKETIGHVATLTLTNHSDETFTIRIPPTILASKTGKVQNYGLTETVETTLAPRETKAIPLTGVCLDARVPPAGPEDKDELALLDPETLDRNWKTQLGGTQAVIKTTRELQRQGIYKTPYSKNPQKELDTIIQWTTWLFVSTLKGNPVKKEDLAKKVYEQAEQVKGPLPPEKKEELKEGVDDIWEAVQLTGSKAKLLPGETVKISDEEEGKSTPPLPGGILAKEGEPEAPAEQPKPDLVPPKRLKPDPFEILTEAFSEANREALLQKVYEKSWKAWGKYKAKKKEASLKRLRGEDFEAEKAEEEAKKLEQEYAEAEIDAEERTRELYEEWGLPWTGPPLGVWPSEDYVPPADDFGA